MDILIRGMEMPTSCAKCKIKNAIKCNRWELVRSVVLDRHRDCPLVPIQPHGRLIDADTFDERIRVAGGLADEELSDDFKDGVQTTLLMLKTHRTIIPASFENPTKNARYSQDNLTGEGE